MGKKKAPVASDVSASGDGKTRLAIRFDTDVYEGCRKLAEGAGISINQLLHGAARWLVKNGRVGSAQVGTDGKIQEIEQDRGVPGLLWFGRYETTYTEEEAEYLNEELSRLPEEHQIRGPYTAGEVEKPAVIAFRLDFTERRVVREDE